MSKLMPFSGRSRTLSERKEQGLQNKTPSFFEKLFRQTSKGKTLDLEEVIDLDKNYDNFTQRELEILDPRKLYEVSKWQISTGLYKKKREDILQIGDGDHAMIPLISKESSLKLEKSSYTMMHIGMIIIGVKGLHRKGLGAKTLIVLTDTGLATQSQKLIASMEVDMNDNLGIFYCTPDIIYSMKAVTKHLRVGVMTKGYGAIQHENLHLTIAVLGKTTQNTTLNFKLNINSIIEAVASYGINMIKPEPVSSDELAGKSWDLERIFGVKEDLILPSKSTIFEDSKGNISLRFSKYTVASHEEDSD